jgi:beta-glucosidase
MGATWNTDLIGQVGTALAEETKAKGAHILLGPTVNIHRSPISGRNFECFSEDPYLTQKLAVAYITGLQAEGVGACVKHYVCNDQEYDRHNMSSDVSERALREIYFAPFEAAIKEAKSWSIMSAYNRVNGTWASEHPRLLDEVLKREWGFDGLVISDWYGTYSSNVIQTGLDLEMPGPARWTSEEKVLKAIELDPSIVEKIDDKVKRLLLLLERTDAINHPIQEEQEINNPDHIKLIHQVGQEAIVLLKNDNQTLPLEFAENGTLAVIGPSANVTQFQGGGSSQVSPHYMVSPLEAIQVYGAKNDILVEYVEGPPIYRQPPVIPASVLRSSDGQEGNLLAEFFDNLNFEGKPVHTDYFPTTELGMFGQVADGFDPTKFSLRTSGEFTVPYSGNYKLSFAVVGKEGKFIINDETIAILSQAEIKEGSVSEYLFNTVEKEFIAGEIYRIQMDYVTLADIQWRAIRFGMEYLDGPDPVDEAVEIAKKVDKVVIIAGLTPEWEAEGFDRIDMLLPNRQNELIEKVSAVNKNVVVCLNVGSPVAMPWIHQVSAVLQTWYLGQETGNAIADILFGKANPSGKLPTSFPKKLEDNPSYINFPGENAHVNYGEGLYVGYRYYDKKQNKPLFPFGHGLSYTNFEYTDLVLPNGVTPGERVIITLQLENSGEISGKEVVQLYVRDIVSKLDRPLKELKAFEKIELAENEQTTVGFELDSRAFSYYDDSKNSWTLEPGEFEILIGSSSQDIRLSGIIDIKLEK